MLSFPFWAGYAGACEHHAKGQQPAFEKGAMEVKTAGGTIPFSIEIARSSEQLAHGLMHRTDLPDGYAMLFVFPTVGQHGMWMKDTPSSLDMLFVDSMGRIVYIHPDTIPYSLATVTTPVPVKAVVEMPAGTVRKHGIREGDIILHGTFKP